MAEYTLYCYAQSGYCFMAALMLKLCGADWAPRHVDYFNGETRTPAYREINVMGEVPVLEFRDGGALKRLSQSGVSWTI
jgi:glutathione S-transferase